MLPQSILSFSPTPSTGRMINSPKHFVPPVVLDPIGVRPRIFGLGATSIGLTDNV
jgi:hypothetical protein